MKIVDLSIRRPVTVTMAFVAVVVFGLVSFTRLPVDLLPDLSFPTVTIETDYDGVGPREIESLISQPIEEAIGVVRGVQQVTSRSRPGRSEITVQFRWGTDMDFATLDLRDRLDLISLPSDAGRPTIARYDPSSEPVVRLALVTDRILDVAVARDREALLELRLIADEMVRRGIEGVEGVAAVRLTGGLEEEILVAIDEARLGQLGIPFAQVSNRLGAENINLSGGVLEDGTSRYAVRTVNEFSSPDEMASVVIGQAGGTRVLLGDVATITRQGQERQTISLVNGAESVELAVLRESTANIVQVSEAILSRARVLEIPAGVSLVVVSDQATFIRQAVADVRNAAIVGGGIAMLILLLFLRHLPTTLIIATAIPISIISTFVLMFGQDISLNIMSLGGLALGVGMLVDSAIVVLESIARERERGASAIEAASLGTARVGTAVVASTLTTVAVFLPIVFVQGIAGQLFGDQAWTVSFALLSALVVALTLIPMLAAFGQGARARTGEGGADGVGGADVRADSGEPKSSWTGEAVAAGAGGILHLGRGVFHALRIATLPLASGFEWTYGRLERGYGRWLSAVLRRPLPVLIGSTVALAVGVALIPRVGIELIPEMRQGELVVELEGSPGTSLTRMEELARQAETRLLADPQVREVFTSVGVRGGAGTLGRTGERQIHAATILTRLTVSGSAEDPVAARLQLLLQDLPGLQVRVDRPRLFAASTPLEVEVRGYDLALLDEVAGEVRGLLAGVPGVGGVDDARRQATPELIVSFDRDQLARNGLTVADAAQGLRARVRGLDATGFTERDRDLNVLVRARDGQRATLEDLRDLRIEVPGGGTVSISSVATLGFAEGPAEIIRRGGSRVSLVEARPTGRDLASTIARVEATLEATPVPEDITLAVGGQSQDLRDSMRSMQLALLLALFLVFLVLASQFESFRLPAVILVAVPLALPGAIGALWITGHPISVVALIGMVMLVGIVVNNAIVFVDCVNGLRRDEGMALEEALVEAGRLRFRPIVMSSLTTVLGLLPLALIPGEAAELRIPLAVPVIGGLILSTILTLLVVPVLYRTIEAGAERRAHEGSASAKGAAPSSIPLPDATGA